MTIWQNFQQIITYILHLATGAVGLLIMFGMIKSEKACDPEIQLQSYGLICILFSMVMYLSFRMRILEDKLENG